MSDSGDTMGSLLDSGPVVEPPDDPEDLEAPRVAIDIHPTADRDELAGQFAALLAAHTAEQKKLESRIEILEALRLTEKMAEAAEAASSASSAAAQSAAEAARLVLGADEVWVKTLADDGEFILSLLLGVRAAVGRLGVEWLRGNQPVG